MTRRVDVELSSRPRERGRDENEPSRRVFPTRRLPFQMMRRAGALMGRGGRGGGPRQAAATGVGGAAEAEGRRDEEEADVEILRRALGVSRWRELGEDTLPEMAATTGGGAWGSIAGGGEGRGTVKSMAVKGNSTHRPLVSLTRHGVV